MCVFMFLLTFELSGKHAERLDRIVSFIANNPKLGLNTYDRIYNKCRFGGNFFIQINMLNGLVKIKIRNFMLSGIYNFILGKWKSCVISHIVCTYFWVLVWGTKDQI